ncbi:hypothetical protein [Streptomyces sp. NPDC055134]
MPRVEDQRPVEEFPPASADPPLNEGVCPRGPYRAEQHLDALRGEDGVEGVGELRISVPDQELHLVNAVVECHEEVAGLLGSLASGWVGGDAEKWTRRVEISMTAMQCRRRSRMVSRWERSTAMIPEAWLRRNSAQVGPERRGAGSIPALFRIVDDQATAPTVRYPKTEKRG